MVAVQYTVGTTGAIDAAVDAEPENSEITSASPSGPSVESGIPPPPREVNEQKMVPAVQNTSPLMTTGEGAADDEVASDSQSE